MNHSFLKHAFATTAGLMMGLTYLGVYSLLVEPPFSPLQVVGGMAVLAAVTSVFSWHFLSTE